MMEFLESNRQKKIGSLFKKELASLFQELIRQENKENLILSITKVYVTPDIFAIEISGVTYTLVIDKIKFSLFSCLISS